MASWFYLTLDTSETPTPEAPEQESGGGRHFAYGPVLRHEDEAIIKATISLGRRDRITVPANLSLAREVSSKIPASLALSRHVEQSIPASRMPAVRLQQILVEDEALVIDDDLVALL